MTPAGNAAAQKHVGPVPELSVILPAFNEEGNIRVVFDRIKAVVGELGITHEIVFVDDGSTDRTSEEVRALQSEAANVRLVRFTRNFGHQAALLAGMRTAAGRGVVMMDCDLQHPPELIPEMVRLWKSGIPVVQTIRKGASEVSLWKRAWSSAFYRLINLLSYTPVRPNAADFRLLDRVVIDELLRLDDYQPFIRGMIGWLGHDSAVIEFEVGKRHWGEARYSFRKSFGLATMALTRLSKLPLRVSLYAGLIAAGASLALGAFALVSYAGGGTVPGWASIVVPVFFIGGVQLIVLGVLGEYIGLVYDQTRHLPSYVAYPEDQAPDPANEGAASGAKKRTA
jgi:dolichol-phosphate mannosyltransferase